MSLHSTGGHTYWNCQCDCGKFRKVESYQLHTGRTQSCGCLTKELARKRAYHVKPGTEFGDLTVIQEIEPVYLPSGQRNRVYECQCVCGNKTNVRHLHLIRNRILSCGCRIGERHGLRKTKLYSVYKSMKERCYKSYASDHCRRRYRDRGITVCEEWRDSFKSFYNWSMSNGYAEGLQIDRINNDKGYSPDNCRWVTREVNMNNMSTNRRLTFRGETRTYAQWSECLDLPYSTLWNRISVLRWDTERALMTPARKRGHKKERHSKVT